MTKSYIYCKVGARGTHKPFMEVKVPEENEIEADLEEEWKEFVREEGLEWKSTDEIVEDEMKELFEELGFEDLEEGWAFLRKLLR